MFSFIVSFFIVNEVWFKVFLFLVDSIVCLLVGSKLLYVLIVLVSLW